MKMNFILEKTGRPPVGPANRSRLARNQRLVRAGFENAGRTAALAFSKPALKGVLLLALLCGPAPGAKAIAPGLYSLTLAWDASTSPGVASYKLYYGTASGLYTQVMPVVDVTSVLVQKLSEGVTYYFAMTSVDANGQESAYSGEISYQIPPPPVRLQFQAAPGASFVLSGSGQSGHSYEVQATEDFLVWTNLGPVTTDAGGSFIFPDTNSMNFPHRYYRTWDPQP